LRGAEAFTSTTRRAVVGLLLVAAVVANLVGSAATVPPGTAMVAALVAGATLSRRDTAVVTVLAFVTTIVLALADDLDGGEIAARAVVAAVIGAIAWAIARRLAPSWTAMPPAEDDLDGNGHSLAQPLMRARTVGDVAGVAARYSRDVLGASIVRLAVRAERDLFHYVEDSLPPEVHEEHAFFSLHGADPSAVAIRNGKPQYWTSFRSFARSHQRTGPLFDHAEPQAVAILPLVGERQAVGVLVLVFSDHQTFDREDRRALESVAIEVTVALERAVLYEFERSVASELQRSLLGPPVLIEGAGHCARYLPAVSSLTVGGDWYDTIKLGDGRIGIAVGDAVGRGLAAATVMGQLRSALAACALRSANAGDALDCLDEFAANVPAANSTTVLYAIVDLEHEQLEYCAAGHPPPLCVKPDGSAQFLEDGRSWPLGLGIDRRRPYATAPFEAGSLVVLYSDGLIERRRQSLDVGLERLVAETRARVKLPIDQLADELLERMLADGEGSDDVVLLILRSPVSTPDLFLRKVRAVPEMLGPIRRELREWLDQAGVDPLQGADLLIATGEACMNVVQHAYSSDAHRLVRIEGAVIDGELVITVTDTGTWKEYSRQSVGGRGMRLMRQLVPSVEVKRRTSGTSVTFRCDVERSGERTAALH
jgi:serine phosphatase RsbU (regulator of sigma subunit)/anti-sigma regulatory factor (Ser/Thr protein kinase)